MGLKWLNLSRIDEFADRRIGVAPETAQIVGGRAHRDDIGIFLVHVKKVDGVARFVAIEDAFLNDLHTKPMTGGVDDRRANAAARALARDQKRIDPQTDEFGNQGSAPKRAGCGLADDHVALLWRDFVEDVEPPAKTLARRGIVQVHSARRSRMNRFGPAGNAGVFIP